MWDVFVYTDKWFSVHLRISIVESSIFGSTFLGFTRDYQLIYIFNII